MTFAFLALIATACNSQVPSTSNLPAITASFESPKSILPTPEPTIDYFAKHYTTTLDLPDGRVLPMYCTYVVESKCRAVFPNGEIMPASYQPQWSPDGKFALVCGSYTSHDTPCSFYGVCDLVRERCDNYFISIYWRWHPEKPHTIVYFYYSSYLGEPDHVVFFDPETGTKEVFFEACPNWFYQEYPGLCDLLPTVIIGGQLEGLPEDVVAKVTVDDLDDDDAAHLRFMSWQGSGTWADNLSNSSGRTYKVMAEAEGYISLPPSYTIQVDGSKAYVVAGGRLTADEADHLDFRFKKKE